MPALPDLHERLSDGAVELRSASEWDIPDILIAHQDDPELHRRLGLGRAPSGAELGRAAERAVAEREAGTRLELSVVEPGQDTCRGRVVLHGIDWSRRRAELGIWLAPQCRGRGLAPRVLRLSVGWLFRATSLERLEVVTGPDDLPMVRAARTAGFREDGVSEDRVRLSVSRPRV